MNQNNQNDQGDEGYHDNGLISLEFKYNENTVAVFDYELIPQNVLEGTINADKTLAEQSFNESFNLIPDFNRQELRTVQDVNRYFLLSHINQLPPDLHNIENELNQYLEDNSDYNFGIRLINYGNVYANLTEQYYVMLLNFLSFKLLNTANNDFPVNLDESTFILSEIILRKEFLISYIRFFYAVGYRRTFTRNREEDQRAYDQAQLDLQRELGEIDENDMEVEDDEDFQFNPNVLNQNINNNQLNVINRVSRYTLDDVNHIESNRFEHNTFYIRDLNNFELWTFLGNFMHIQTLNYYKLRKIYNLSDFNNFALSRNFFKLNGFGVFFDENILDDQGNIEMNNYFKRVTDNIGRRRPILNNTIQRIAKNSEFNNIVEEGSNINNFHFIDDARRQRYIELYQFLYNEIVNENVIDETYNHKEKYFEIYKIILKNVAYDLLIIENMINVHEIVDNNERISCSINYLNHGMEGYRFINDVKFRESAKKSFCLFYLIYVISTCENIVIQDLLIKYFKFLDEIFMNRHETQELPDLFFYGQGMYLGLIYFLYSVYGGIPSAYIELDFDNLIKKLFNNRRYNNSITTFEVSILVDSIIDNDIAIPFYNLIDNNVVIQNFRETGKIKTIFPCLWDNYIRERSRINRNFYISLFNTFNIILAADWNIFKMFNDNATCEDLEEESFNALRELAIVDLIRNIFNQRDINGRFVMTQRRFIYLSKILYLVYQFAKDNFGRVNICFDMRVFSRLTFLTGIRRETFFFRNISIYGSYLTSDTDWEEFNEDNLKFIKLMNINDVERYIIGLRSAIGNRLPLYIGLYFIDGGRDNYIKKIVPINRISNRFLTAAFLDHNDNINNVNVNENERTYEYYKRVKANSRLFYAFDMRSIGGIQINMDCILANDRADVYGNYLPIKLRGYNEVLKQFAFYSQIYVPDEKVDQRYNCFYWSIHINNYYGNKVFDNEELVDIYYKYGKGTITLEKIKQFHDEYKVNIRIKKIVYVLDGLKKIKNDYKLINNKYQREITIAHIKYETYNHFFAIVPIRITKFCCQHLNLLKSEYYEIDSGSGIEIENYEIKAKTKIHRSYMDKDYTNTYKLFKGLLKQELTEFVSAYEMEEFMNNVSEVKPNINMIMNFSNVQTKNIDIKSEDANYRLKKKKSKPLIAAADSETYVDENNKLVPFCLCLVYNTYKGEIIKKSFYGPYCQRDFLYYLFEKNIREVYFHNLKFDGWLFKNFQIVDMVYHACRLYRLCILVGNGEVRKKIYFKDSLALIPTKLKNFPRMFKLENMEKELYPYNKINAEVIDNNNLDINECKSEFNDKDFIEFKNMLNNKGFINDNKIDIKSLTIYYCVRDCEILYYGLKKFEEMTMKLFNNINGLRFLTISSLSFYIMTEECFDGLNSYCGDIKKFIRMAVRGGRCMVANNKKVKVNEEIVDFDACSLYPSAMSRLYLPKGKVFGSKDKDEIKLIYKCLMDEDQIIKTNDKFISAMIIKCKIIKVGKNRSFPLLSYVEDGLSNYSNDMIGKEVYLTHIEVQDFIKYQEGEVEMLECIYWAGNKDTRMAEKIKHYYNLRAQYKKEGNQLQEVLKLFMNSSYGKTIQKDTETEDKITHKIGTDSFLKNNYGRIKEVIELNKESYWIKLDGSTSSSYIPVQIGCLILGMSKRIMNEVICTAEDNNIDVYYQDTDSIHIKRKDVESLARAFEASFGRELIGVEMGQFHVDFPLINNKETWSKKSIFLGKKCYIDCLTNIDGKEEDFIRMKGVPEKVIRNTAKDMNIQLYDLYDKMYDGEEISFDLLNSNMPSFEYQKNFGIKLREEFKRILKFK